ncbi:MAG: IPT/TIG domain-containing protein [Chloroflexi bacterium]|nr:IPT/TIG domain-containing protein [Chloroflexota bacterium]
MAGGTVVTVFGSGFIGVTAVSFGPLPAEGFTVRSSTELVTTSTPYSAITGLPHPGTGRVAISVTTPAGTSAANSADQFTYIAPALPELASLTPSSGPTGTTVTLKGSGFGTSPGRVTFTPQSGGRGLTAPIVHWSDTAIVCTVPRGLLAGTNAIPNVWSAAGLMAGPASNSAWPIFSVTSGPGSTPTITALDPKSAHSGARFTVTGSNLGSAAEGTVVFCDFCHIPQSRRNAAITSWTQTKIVGTVPGDLQCGGAQVWVTVGSWRGLAGRMWITCGP